MKRRDRGTDDGSDESDDDFAGEQIEEDIEVLEPDAVFSAEDLESHDLDKGVRLAPALLAASVALMVIGVLLMLVVVPLALRPEASRCDLARSFIKDANENDRAWDDIDLGGRSTKDLGCDEALALAETILLAEDGSVTRAVPSADSIRNQGLITGLLGAGQVASGTAVIVTRNRRARNTAVAFAFVSLIVPLLGMVSIALVLAIVYGLVFSPAARLRWPKKRLSFGR